MAHWVDASLMPTNTESSVVLFSVVVVSGLDLSLSNYDYILLPPISPTSDLARSLSIFSKHSSPPCQTWMILLLSHHHHPFQNCTYLHDAIPSAHLIDNGNAFITPESTWTIIMSRPSNALTVILIITASRYIYSKLLSNKKPPQCFFSSFFYFTRGNENWINDKA